MALAEDEVLGADGFMYESDWETIRSQLQPAFASLAQDELEFMNGLIAFDGWPDDVQADVDGLIEEMASEATWLQTLASAPAFAAMSLITPPPDEANAAVVRAKLGLESNIGATTQFCVELAG